MNQADGRRVAGLNLQPGTSGMNIGIFMLACWVGILTATFVPSLQPFLLTEFLQVPRDEQGVISGYLAFLGELVFIVSAGLWGTLSDKYGRRPVAAAAYLLMGAGLWCYPRVDSIYQLYLARCLIGFGAAAYSSTALTLIADYARHESRGKLTGYHGIANGLGALTTVFLLLRLPAIMQGQGLSPQEAGLFTYNCVATLNLAMAALSWLGLRGGLLDNSSGHESLVQLTRHAIRAAAASPHIRLSYAAAFVSRGNLTIVGTFFTLWLANHGTGVGMDTAQAMARAGMMVGVAQLVTVIGAPVFGALSDRFDHLKMLMIALGFAAIGYGSTWLIADPFGTAMIICALFIGLGEVGCIITSAVLIADQAPEHARGSVIGGFNICGGLGILVASGIGGYLFDLWDPTGPFVMFAAFAALVLLWAAVIQARSRTVAQSD